MRKLRSQAGEKLIYNYNNGEAVVTDKLFVLGAEAWPIENLVNAALLDYQLPSWRRYINATTVSGLFVALLLFVVGLFFLWFADAIVFFVYIASASACAGILMLVLSAYVVWYVIFKNPLKSYIIRLTIRDTHGGQWNYDAKYTFRYRSQAMKTVLAVQKALESRSLLF